MGDFGEDVGVIGEAEPFSCPRDLVGGVCGKGAGELGQAMKGQQPGNPA